MSRPAPYPFGHGLSYTSFSYADLTTNLTGRHQDGDLLVHVTCQLTNTGDRHGSDVAQLDVRDPQASMARPVRELNAFAKVALDPGQTTKVDFVLTPGDLSYWSTIHHDWVLEAASSSSRSAPPPATCGSPSPSTSPRPPAAGPARRHVHPPGVARRPHRLCPAADGGRGLPHEPASLPSDGDVKER